MRLRVSRKLSAGKDRVAFVIAVASTQRPVLRFAKSPLVKLTPGRSR